MRFGLTDEQRAFAGALDDLLGSSDVPQTARQWADGDPAPGLELWRRLADLGVAGLLVPEEHGGLGASMTDLVVAFDRLGHHCVPGPWLETAALAPAVLTAIGDPDGLLPGLVDGKVTFAIAMLPLAPFAIDAAYATHRLVIDAGLVSEADVVATLESVDPTRRPAKLGGRAVLGAITPAVVSDATNRAALATAAQLIGCGERMLAESVDYVSVRRQFGRVVGEFQSVKHLLADARVALDFATPLVQGAAYSFDEGADTTTRDVSAAKVAAADAAWLTARVALQVHGAIGYTREHNLSLWFTRTRALVGAWGTPAWHRSRVLAELTGGRS